jgi:hypothetical protein
LEDCLTTDEWIREKPEEEGLFFQAVISSLTANIAVIDREGNTDS